jgi:hypothetical protein
MTALLCPEGHLSDEADYCSVCGVAMDAPAVGATPSPAGALSSAAAAAHPGIKGTPCPVCAEPRADLDARFCEVCRYDFVGKSASEARPPAAALPQPAQAAPPAAHPAAPAPTPLAPTAAPAQPFSATPNPPGLAAPQPPQQPFLTAASRAQRWELVITTDPSLDTEPDPASPCPVGLPPIVVQVAGAEVLVGREPLAPGPREHQRLEAQRG